MKTTIVLSTLLMALSAAAIADSNGEPGELVGFREVGTSADNFSFFRGSIWVAESGRVRQYFWGGSNCVSKDLTEQEAANLAGGLEKWIIPIYSPGQLPETRCLKEYILIERKFVDAADPFPFGQ